jgi:hypothetical protein
VASVNLVANSNLKKQSQFPEGQIGIKTYSKGAYGMMMPFGARKNKPNQSQCIRTACFENEFEKTKFILSEVEWANFEIIKYKLGGRNSPVYRILTTSFLLSFSLIFMNEFIQLL